MKHSAELHRETTLILNDREAKWLKDLCQSTLTLNESEEDKVMRNTFWNALDEEGI